MEALLLLPLIIGNWGVSDYWRSVPKQDYHRAVVRVSQGQYNGSGVVVHLGPNKTWGVVATNWHVADQDVRTWVYWGHSGYRTAGKVFRRNFWHDLALIWVRPPADCEMIPFSFDDPEPGAQIELAGYGRTEMQSQRWYGEFIQRPDPSTVLVDCYMFAGHSGGPLVYRGRLLGLIAYGVPVNRRQNLYWRARGPSASFISDYLNKFLQSEASLETIP